MSVKRKDFKGRILQTGESQRKDGRYMYKYIGDDGRNRYIYSSRLKESDPVTEKNKDELSLREKIAELEKNRLLGISTSIKLTVAEAISRYVSGRINLSDNTIMLYNYVVDFVKKEKIAKLNVTAVKTSDVKYWFARLQQVQGKSMSTLKVIKTVLQQTFQELVEDDVVLKNPFIFKLSSVIVNDRAKREALTEYDEKVFLNYIKNDSYYSAYYKPIYILLNTGLRISELMGLTAKDIDFDNNVINVDHQVTVSINSKDLKIGKTKTRSGNRKVPMINNVSDYFRDIIRERPKRNIGFTVNGYSGFLFLSEKNTLIRADAWDSRFMNIVNSYNSKHSYKLPHITPHICRHTFCSRMANKGMNPKALQYIMGHSDVNITLNTYTHTSIHEAKEEVDRILNCM